LRSLARGRVFLDAEAFLIREDHTLRPSLSAKITPLFNELDALAERLRDTRRNLV
jgi:hypothetical protein